METLSLPPPRKSGLAPQHSATANGGGSSQKAGGGDNGSGKAQQQNKQPPSYEERCRAAAEASRLTPEQRRKGGKKLFVPRSLDDFGDGGAYPEIHVAQYPRHMGNPHLKRKIANKPGAGGGSGGGSGGAARGTQAASTAIVNVEIDEKGEVSYDAIVKGGTNADKIVYARHDDLRGGEAKPEDVALPTEEEEREEAERTNAALQALLGKKTALDKPSGSAMVNAETSKNVEEKTQFISYKPRPDAPGYNPAAAQRVIQMVPAQVDPMMPPKHKHLKAPRGPAEDPVPVLHAPPEKLSKEEKAQWNIPACISNWKNTRGFTIPLDKRLAADGRGLREHSINPNFATLSESLYVAERQARQEVRMRAQVQKKLALQEKEKREEELRELANRARLERGGAVVAAAPASSKPSAAGDDDGDEKVPAASSGGDDSDDESADEVPVPGRKDDEKNLTEDDVAARQRERLRLERKREREREMRMENNVELKKKRLEEERDVSEKIALGVHTGSGGGGLGGDVDSRLYNQTAGMDTGFGAEDDYNAYSKPLFGDRVGASQSIYRPTRGEAAYDADEQYDKLLEGSTSKFQPDKGFAGAEGGMDNVRAGPRTAPVQFEKDSGGSSKKK